VWGYSKALDQYLIKLDNVIGSLGESLETGDVYSPIPCDHVLLLDSSTDLQLPEQAHESGGAVKRVLSAEALQNLGELPAWQLILTEKTPYAQCVMAELIDEADDEDEEDGEKVGKKDVGGKQGRRRGGTLDDGGKKGREDCADGRLVYCPRLKYEGSGRLLDMLPWDGSEFSLDAEDHGVTTDFLKDEYASQLYEIVRAEEGGVSTMLTTEAKERALEAEQSGLWYQIRKEVYDGRMQELLTGKLSLTGDENSVEQHLNFHVKDCKHSNVKKQRYGSKSVRKTSRLCMLICF
jgi:hypothetical protein